MARIWGQRSVTIQTELPPSANRLRRLTHIGVQLGPTCLGIFDCRRVVYSSSRWVRIARRWWVSSRAAQPSGGKYFEHTYAKHERWKRLDFFANRRWPLAIPCPRLQIGFED